MGAFAGGEILQVLLFSVLFGLALARFGENGRNRWSTSSISSRTSLFDVIGIIMRVAPIGAFGAMAFTIGKYGVGTLARLGKLMACVYLTCLLFVVVVLGTIARLAGFRLWPFLRYIKEEILIVLGTSSSEAALPRMITKLENLGCARPVVGPGDPDRVLVQPGRHVDLSHHGGDLHRAGHERAPEPGPAAVDTGRALAHLQGVRSRDRRRLYHPGRDALQHRQHSRRRAGADPGDRPLHVGGPGDHEPDRQRRGDHGGRPLGRALDIERVRAVLSARSEALAEEPEAVADALSEGVPLASELDLSGRPSIRVAARYDLAIMASLKAVRKMNGILVFIATWSV